MLLGYGIFIFESTFRHFGGLVGFYLALMGHVLVILAVFNVFMAIRVLAAESQVVESSHLGNGRIHAIHCFGSTFSKAFELSFFLVLVWNAL